MSYTRTRMSWLPLLTTHSVKPGCSLVCRSKDYPGGYPVRPRPMDPPRPLQAGISHLQILLRRSGKIPALRLFPNRQYPAVYRFRQSFLGMVWSHSPLGVFHRYPGKPESLDTIHVLGMLSRNVHVFYRIRSRHTFLLARSPERLSSLSFNSLFFLA